MVLVHAHVVELQEVVHEFGLYVGLVDESVENGEGTYKLLSVIITRPMCFDCVDVIQQAMVLEGVEAEVLSFGSFRLLRLGFTLPLPAGLCLSLSLCLSFTGRLRNHSVLCLLLSHGCFSASSGGLFTWKLIR